MFEYLLPPAVFLLQKQYSFASFDFGSSEYHVPLLGATAFIVITAIAAAMVDAQILFRMFTGVKDLGGPLHMLSSKSDMFVFVNWVCSVIVLFTLPYVMSSSSVNTAGSSEQHVISPSLKAAIIFGFSSISYLMGYFGILLEMKRQDAKRMRRSFAEWKQFVPPLFYIGISLFAFRSHSTIAAAIACVFFAVYAANIAFHRFAFTHDFPVPATEEPQVACEPTAAPSSACDSTDTSLYRLYQAPPGSGTRHWLRQICYDLAVYLLPMTAVPLALPSLQIPVTVFCIFLTFWQPVYEFIAKRMFLQSSPPQDQSRVEDRKRTYPEGANFPKGWFSVLLSNELSVSQVKYVQVMGRDLAIFRGEDNIVRCLHAYCIHLGANMAIGGKVKGNCLECPFHQWSFDGEGACSAIRYQPKVPSTARTRAYSVTEFYGMICVWFGPIGEEPEISGVSKTIVTSVPDYYPPALDKIDNGNMVLRGTTRLIVNMHIQEFAENSTDFAHFLPLHGTMCFPFTLTELPAKMITINHIPDWKDGQGDEAHRAWFYDKADLNIFGTHYPETGAMAVIHFIGPGGLVFFTFDTPLGSLILFQTNTPIADGMKLEAAFRWYADATMPRFLVWYIVGNWIAQYQNDIMIWENKKFLKNPVLVKGDGPMNKQRRWYKQFYEKKDSTSGATAVAPEAVTTEW